MKRLKGAYFVGSLNRGGLENLMLDVCRKHAYAPYDMVCVYRYDGNMSDEFRKTGVPLIRISKEKGTLRQLWNLRRTMLQEQVDIVHSQSAISTILLAFALMGTPIKIMTTFHGNLFANAPWWKRKIVYRTSEKIICVSEYQKRFYEEKWMLPKENKLRVVYNGIDFTKLDNVKNERVSELESEHIKFAMVGNFIKGRSQINVVKAIKIIDDRSIDDRLTPFDFYFVGYRDKNDPERYDQCVRYCDENGLKNVHFLGSRNDVPAILRTIDGFVYSTEHDTFGIAVIEAVASGLPVVVNDWSVMKEVCNLGLPKENKAIRFFRTDDVEDCAAKMEELLQDIQKNKLKLKDDCAEAAKAAKKYSIENHINRTYQEYMTL